MNLKKIKRDPVIILKLVTCQRITSKILKHDGSTPEPTILSGDTGQRQEPITPLLSADTLF